MKTYLLINPNAGLLKGKKDTSEVKQSLVGLKGYMDFTIARNSTDIQKFIKRVKRNKPDRVLIAGGDGTVAAVLTGLFDVDVTFGIIPTGSTNNIGHSLGLPEDIDRLISIINRGKVSSMDLGKVNGKIFIESVGIGLLATIMEKIGEQDSKKEVLKVLAQTLEEVVSTQSIPVYIDIDGRTQVLSTVWLTITNTGRAAAVTVDPESNVHDSKFEIIQCDPLTKTEIPSYVQAFFANEHIQKEKFHRFTGSMIFLTLPPDIAVHVDGQLFIWNKVKVEVLPRQIKVLVP